MVVLVILLEDLLSVDPTDLVQPIAYTVTAKTLQRLTFASSTYNDGIFTVGASVKERAGSITTASLVYRNHTSVVFLLVTESNIQQRFLAPSTTVKW